MTRAPARAFTGACAAALAAASLVTTSLAAGGATPANASEVPRAGPADPRLRTVRYDPNEVVTLKGFYGYQMVIEFGDDERLENVSIGDSLGWQVTPNRKANLLFIKPVEKDAATNMSVITNLRRYAFELTSGEASGPRDPNLIFALRFQYPQEQPAQVSVYHAPESQTPAPERWNLAYAFMGVTALAPARVFDDGTSTYFQWRAGQAAPAVYARNAAGEESLVNYLVRGDYVVVQEVAPEFVLRSGKSALYVRNDAFGAGQPRAIAERPPEVKRWTSFGASP